MRYGFRKVSRLISILSMIWEVEFVTNTKGINSVELLIKSLDSKAAAKTIRVIELLSEFGPYLRMPFTKKIGDRLWELRIEGKVSLRILYTKIGSRYFLIHGFVKKTNKIPNKELKIALAKIAKLL